MILNELFKPRKIIALFEGGNLELPNPNDPTAPYQADEIDLKVHNRSFMVGLLDKLLNDINGAFYSKYKKPLWNPNLIQSKQFLGGSSLHFFNTTGITDKEFAKSKPKVGDIDTQCNKELEPEIRDFLTTYDHKQVGDTTLLGFSQGSEQLNALFQFQDPPIKIQIDFEFGRYDPETDMPDEWYRFSHSSEWNDVQAGIKGVFHKWIYRALTSAHSSVKHQVDVKKTKTNIKPNVRDNDLSFAVASGQGGGLSQKYEPYIHTDPETGEKQTHKDEVPYKRLIPSAERTYIQQLDKQFYYFFGTNPEGNDKELQKSFLGTLELINRYIPDPASKESVFKAFLDLCFDPGNGQMITKNDPERDQEIKFAAIDNFVKICKLGKLRNTAVEMGKAYIDEFNEVQAYKKEHPEEKQPRAALKRAKAANQPVEENFADGRHPEDKGDSKRHGIPKHATLSQLDKMTHAGGRKGQLAHWQANMRRGRAKHESLNEADVKAQLRKGMPHLKDLKAADFLDLLDEIHDGNGNFKLENMPLNVKVDGFGGRFGKNADGKPFMGTSRTEPRYAPGFLKYHQEKGTQDPEILGRAKLFDDLFVEMMNAVKLVDSKLGPDFLMDKQVSCEVLFLPFATETEEGKLKFVGIHYDKLPQGVQLALVPFHVVTASTGEPVENSQEIVKELTGLGQQSSVMFIDNSLTQNEALDVTAIIPPLENIEELKSIVSDTMGKRDRASLELKKNVEAQLQPVKLALEKAIAEDPNIIGKDMLGKDYEGIVLNTRLGPVKITSAEQRAVIAGKQAAKTSARTERPRGESKTAVVAIGSFIGHKGHEELFNYTIKKAKELGGDPYLFIGNAEGKDDPIPPAVKVQTWHKLYPEYANNISTVQQGGQLIQKIKHELINPLPGKPPRYDNIIIMVGEDRKDLNMPQALMKAVNKFQGYEHVKVSLGVTPRGTGISGTLLRNSLKNDPPEKALAVWSNAFDVKKLGEDWIEHLMDITRKGMGIQQQTQQQPAPVAERLFNALMAPKINESTSLESTIKNIVTNGEPIAQLYEKLKAMAKRWVDNNGSLKGYHRNAAGQSAQWFNNFYWNKMQGDLYDLTKQASKYAPPLIAFLKDASEDRERSINFREISASLPSILQQIGTRMGNKELSAFGANWNKRQQDYENYLAQIEAEVDTDDNDEYEEPKAPKDNTFGKQNVQADQIVNDILKNLPSKVAGDIRNAIARSPNKLQALQAELQKRGVKAPMAESLIESARMSAAVKLQRAWEREQAKSTASRKRGEEYMNQIKQDVANKNKKPDASKEIEDESIMGFLATPHPPVKKKPTPSSAEMRKYFEKDKPATPEKTERGDGGEKVQRVYTRSDEEQQTPQAQQAAKALQSGILKQKQQYPNLDSAFAAGVIKEIQPDGTVVVAGDNSTGQIKQLLALGGGAQFKVVNDHEISIAQQKPVSQTVAEGGAKYKVRSIGQDKRGEYYISPSTGEKVYKKAKVGDHEVPGSKEIKPKVEAMMPASNFAGSKKNKLGTAGQLKATAKHAKQGDLVGGAAESVHSPAQRAAIAIAKQKEVDEDQRLDPHCWKGYRKQGTKMKGGTRVNNCVKVSEDVENKMSDLIRLLENK